MSDMYYGFSENTESGDTDSTIEYGGSQGEGSQVPPEKKVRKKKGGRGAKKVFAVLGSGVAFGLVAGLVFWGVASVTVLNKLPDTTTVTEIPETATAEEETQTAAEGQATSVETDSQSTGYTSVADVAKQCKSSVVAITCNSVTEVQTFFGTQSYETQGAGSGIIVAENDTELLIATNNHVVSGATALTVCFNDDKDQVCEAVVKGTDADNDLAVVAVQLSDISDDTMSSIKIATLGDSDELTVGENVVAIGNALGQGQSVTSGIVSALNRDVTIDGVTASLIQVDAAINPGNSGGALFNMKGELVGINSAKYASTDVEGMGYSIPITKAKDILNDLMSRQTRTVVDESKRGYLSINCVDVSSDASQMYNIPEGVYVRTVGEGGAADKAGIQEGDIITKLDGISISDKETLVDTLTYYASGETVDVVVQRPGDGGYSEVTLSVTLAPQVLSTDSQSSSNQNGSGSQGNSNGSQGNGSDSSQSGNTGDLFGLFK